ncbi:MAG: MFS transporter [Chloroflexi bacterium]|nr:MFS transporter [Chloroflexota bacterium]
MGVSFYSFGLFIKPMSEELGWSRGSLSLALTLRSLVNMVLGPVVGRILDRSGPRLLMAGGALAAGGSLLLLSQVHTLTQFYLIFGVLWSVGFSTMSGMVTTTVVSKWFVRRRGRAVAIAAMGISIGGITLTQLTAFLLGHYSWRSAWIVLGVLLLVVVVPLALWLMRRQPEDMGLRPDGDAEPGSTPAPPAAPAPRRWRLPLPSARKREERDWTLREAARTPALWMLLIATNLSGLAMSTLTLHQVPLLQDRGLSVATAAAMVTFFATGSLTAKLVWGLAAEFVPLRYLAALNFLGAAAAIGVLFNVHSATAALIYGGVAGFTMGAMPVVQSLLWPDYFGRASLGTIRGALAPIGALSSGFGPYLGGVLFDATGNYSIVLLSLIAATATAGVLMLLSRPPRAPAPRS